MTGSGVLLTGSHEWFDEAYWRLNENVRTVIKGKDEIVELALICLLAEGHLLLEDKPGTGKTSLARAIAASIGPVVDRGFGTEPGEAIPSVARIQFTPDLLPADITGSTVFNQRDRTFEFRPGPVFHHVVLADEINRASPKTQSALLEVMEERHVTVDGTTHPIERPFIVLATQNPVEMEGTYRLPESQLDRFLMRATMGYPGRDDEVDIVIARTEGRTVDAVRPVLEVSEVLDMIDYVRRIGVGLDVARYAVRLVRWTRRDDKDLKLPASVRASIDLVKAAKAKAAIEGPHADGERYPTVDHVKGLAEQVLAHRIQIGAAAALSKKTSSDVIDEMKNVVPPYPDERG